MGLKSSRASCALCPCLQRRCGLRERGFHSHMLFFKSRRECRLHKLRQARGGRGRAGSSLSFVGGGLLSNCAAGGSLHEVAWKWRDFCIAILKNVSTLATRRGPKENEMDSSKSYSLFFFRRYFADFAKNKEAMCFSHVYDQSFERRSQPPGNLEGTRPQMKSDR